MGGGKMSQLMVEVNDAVDAEAKVDEVKILVGRVRVLIRQPKAHEQARRVERCCDIGDEGNRAAFANAICRCPKGGAQRALRRLHRRMRQRHEKGLSCAVALDRQPHTVGTELAEIGLGQFSHTLRILLWHQTHADFS